MHYRALVAEFLGTFALVSAICGAGLFSQAGTLSSIQMALAAGLMLMAVFAALSHISGGHFNPAVTLGLVAGGLAEPVDAVLYIVAQIFGAVCAASIFWIVLSGANAGDWMSFPDIANRYGGKAGFSLTAVLTLEAISTAIFVLIVIATTSPRVPSGLAPIAIGFSFAALQLIAIPVSGASLNPARSTAVAIFANRSALADLWIFWVAPVTGAILAGILSRWLFDE